MWRNCGVRKKLKGLLRPSVDFKPAESCYPLETFESATEHFASVAIKWTGGTGFHVGIINRGPDGSESNLLHLASHAALCSQDFRSGSLKNYFWIVPVGVPPALQRTIALFGRKIHDKNKGSLPYGLFYGPETDFDTYGNLLLSPQSAGLTCATFVLALFKRCGVDLMKIDTWEKRPDDDALLTVMLGVAQEKDPSHVARLRAEPKCVRYRPAEVASACAHAALPLHFVLAERSGASLQGYLITQGL